MVHLVIRNALKPPEAYPEYLTRKEAASFLRERQCYLDWRTLKNMASKNAKHKGPPFYRDGTRVLYKRDELEAWRRARLVPA